MGPILSHTGNHSCSDFKETMAMSHPDNRVSQQDRLLNSPGKLPEKPAGTESEVVSTEVPGWFLLFYLKCFEIFILCA